MSDSVARVPVNLEPTIGTYFIAAIISVGLLGVVSLQCWRYFLNFPTDHILLKLTVLTVWVLEFVKSTLAIHGSYNVVVKNWGNVEMLENPGWSLRAIVIFTTILIFIVHIFFVHKVWLLLRKARVIPIALFVLSLASFVLGVVAYAEASLGRLFEDKKFNIAGRLTVASLACALAVDWSVTISLVVLLRERQSFFSRTKRLIKRLVFYIINIGLLTSLADLVTLVLFNINFHPADALYSISIYEIIGNLYSNSLLACLNSREMVAHELGRPHDLEMLNVNVNLYSTPTPTRIEEGAGQIKVPASPVQPLSK